MDIKIHSLVVDSHDNERLARFWSAVLGWRITYESEDEWVIEPAEESDDADVIPEILFVKTPDEKLVKNRLHLDLTPKDQKAEVGRIIALGATPADIGQGSVGWVVLADPEGNEFCVLAPPIAPA
jgi:predicted enzyme related to lactoylglutathione lyase